MNVNVVNNQSLLPLSELSVSLLVNDFIKYSHVDYDEVAIHFVDTPTICDLHAQYFDDPSPTDCITFPMDEPDSPGYKVMGDIFICPETAIHYVAEHKGDVYRETTLYLVHGLLHLLGYDDIEEADATQMRIREAQYLEQVDKKGLWLYK